jgi:prepilin-type N-terminal cleavage/methylation domain-containing protein
MSFPRTNAEMEVNQISEVRHQRPDIAEREPRRRALPSRSGGPQAAEEFEKAPCLGASRSFTLIELLVVITIIAVMMGLLFPVFRGVLDQARKTQAKSDLVQIVTAVNGYYTEYGKYPLASQGTDASFKTDNSDVINTLRAVASGANTSDALNPRKIVFFSPPDVKDPGNPRAGVTSTGFYYDPWGKRTTNPEAGLYHIAMDGNYDNQMTNPYSANAGSDPLRQGVIAWSLGADGAGGNGNKKTGAALDDVISWQ